MKTSRASTFFAVALVAALPLAAAGLARDEGQGTAQPGSHTGQLNAGQHLLGPAFDASAMLGKVVLVKIGGS